MSNGDLIQVFWSYAPQRIAEITELWIAAEQGDTRRTQTLARALHTVKGEARMLDLPCVGLVQLMEELVKIGPSRLDESAAAAFFSALDVLGMMSTGAEVEPEDLDAVLSELAAAGDAAAARPDAADAEPPSPAEPAVAAPPGTDEPTIGEAAVPQLDPVKLRPLLNQAQRLHQQHIRLRPMLREAHRMFRALMAEIDPALPPHILAERVIKTLGYGAEIERRLADLNAQWSANEFAFGTTLDQMDETVRSASMVSLGQLKSRITRTARTAAQSTGKRVEVSVRGDAHIDAGVEQELGPPLVHLVTNAVDHGLETPEARERAGKPPVGHIEITFQQDHTSVHVTVQDDGRGVDLEALRRKLADQVADVEALDDAEVLRRIFDYGLTTRDDVSELSGRGVGLDIVGRAVRALGGQVRVESQQGLGTRFELALPATLRADVVVPVEADGVRCAVPCRNVEEIRREADFVQTREGPRLRVQQDGGVDFVPVYTLHSLFRKQKAVENGDVVIVVKRPGGRYGLVVDGFDNPRALSFQRMEQLTFKSDLVRGIAPGADGGVYLLLDPERFCDFAGSSAAPRRGDPASGRSGPARVLVVEDAPVARELLVGLLRSFRLQVSDAADGRQGLQRAREELPDMIITDVEMPFVDGLSMLAELRHDTRLRDTPVVVLTTRDEPEVKERAYELGVRGFLSKQRFVETELKQLIERCLGAP